MFFNQAMQAPVVIEIGGERISIPKFTIDDFTAWGAELDTAREKKLTQGMDEEKRFRFMSFYNLLPMELGDLHRLTRSPQGVKRVVRICLQRAAIIARDGTSIDPPEPLAPEKQRLILSAHFQDLARLAEKLSDLYDESKAVRQSQDNSSDADSFAGEAQEGKQESPLTPPVTAESNA